MVIISLVLVISSCRKDEVMEEEVADVVPEPVDADDHRAPYMGDFSFTTWVTSTFQGVYSTGPENYFDGTISIVENSDSLIRIVHLPSGPSSFCSGVEVSTYWCEPILQDDGVMHHPILDNCGPHAGFLGRFFGPDSLSFTSFSGGHTFTQARHVVGRRID